MRRFPGGTFLMSYEVCGQSGKYDCATYTRTSPDGTTWGDPAALGRIVRNDSGQYFAHAPTFTILPPGRLLAVSQMLNNDDGSTAAGNGKTIFISDDNAATWRSASAPVQVPSARNHPCPNYSSQLVPSSDGQSLTEIATDLVGSACKAYVATAPLPA